MQRVSANGIYGRIIDSGWSEQEGVWWLILWESYPDKPIYYKSLDGIRFLA